MVDSAGQDIHQRLGDGPRGTPTVDAGFVYALSANGNLVAAAADGKVRWQTTMQELGGETPNWGYAESVLIDGDKLVCTPGGSQGTLAALHKETGEVLWQSKDFTDGAQYASIIAANHNGRPVYPTDHADLGRHPCRHRRTVVENRLARPGRRNPHPHLSRRQRLHCLGLRRRLQARGAGPGHKVEEVYANKEMKNHHGGVVLVGEHLYGFLDNAGWTCQDFATGKTVWSERKCWAKGL